MTRMNLIPLVRYSSKNFDAILTDALPSAEVIPLGIKKILFFFLSVASMSTDVPSSFQEMSGNCLERETIIHGDDSTIK